MKKFLSIVLAAAMVMAMSVTAFAGESQFDELPGSQDIEVFVRLDTDGDGTPDLDDNTPYGDSICVDLTWPDVVKFIYSTEWDPAQGKFVTVGWQDSDVNLTITNRSTVGVTAELSYSDLGTGYGLVFTQLTLENATFDSETNTVVLANPITLAADENGVYSPSSAMITVTPAGNSATPEEDSDSPVGTITVTLSVTPAEDPQEPQWQEPPILLYNYHTEENVDVDAEVADRGYYAIETGTFEVELGSVCEIRAVEGKYEDGTACNLSVDGTTITNDGGAAGIYYVKFTMVDVDTEVVNPDPDAEPTEAVWYVYLLIKQNAATT